MQKRVCLTGQAQTAYKQLPKETYIKDYRSNSNLKVKVSSILFNSKLKTVRRMNKDWATFAEDLQTLERKAFMNLLADAREQVDPDKLSCTN